MESGTKKSIPINVTNPQIKPLARAPRIYPVASSKFDKGAIKISTMFPWNFDWPMLEAALANEFWSIVIIINPGAINSDKLTLLIWFTDLLRANEKTAKNKSELIAGPMIVWIPTLRNLNTSFLNKVLAGKQF